MGIGGMMSTSGASQLSDGSPSVFALGGCDVASPEFPENICFSLLRHNGVAVYGGTRSVSSCSQHNWLKHHTYYPRLNFGMSTGEVLWSIRADQSRGREIGGTNFLINLLGDPSIVPIRQIKGPPLSVSPGFDPGLEITHADTIPLTVDFEIRNNTDTLQQYTISVDSSLEVSQPTARLQPGQYATVTASVVSPQILTTGEHRFPIHFRAGDQRATRFVVVRVNPKSMVYQHTFDTPIEFLSSENKPLVKTAKESMQKGIFGGAVKVKNEMARLSTPLWAQRENYTLSFYQKVDSDPKHSYDTVRTGNISVLVRDGRVCVWMDPAGWIYGEHPGSKLLKGPKYETGKWQQVAVIYDRSRSLLGIYVQGKLETHQLGFSPMTGFRSSKIELYANENTDYAVDDLHVFNYVLKKQELSSLCTKRFVTPTFPLDGTKVNPAKATLRWINHSQQVAQLQLSRDHEFRQIDFEKSLLNGTILPTLRNGERYFWRVNHPDNAREKRFLPSRLVRSFVADSAAKPLDFEIREIQLPDAKIAQAGYNQRLAPFISGISEQEKKKLSYEKVSGPAWLRVFPDGTLFTNFGPEAGNKGINRFKALVTASDGTTRLADFVIKSVL